MVTKKKKTTTPACPALCAAQAAAALEYAQAVEATMAAQAVEETKRVALLAANAAVMLANCEC